MWKKAAQLVCFLTQRLPAVVVSAVCASSSGSWSQHPHQSAGLLLYRPAAQRSYTWTGPRRGSAEVRYRSQLCRVVCYHGDQAEESCGVLGLGRNKLPVVDRIINQINQNQMLKAKHRSKTKPKMSVDWSRSSTTFGLRGTKTLHRGSRTAPAPAAAESSHTRFSTFLLSKTHQCMITAMIVSWLYKIHTCGDVS